MNSHSHRNGFTLIETLIGSAIFIVIAFSTYKAFAVLMDAVSISAAKLAATTLANEKFEIIRNMPYTDVGIVGGLPLGKIQRTETILRDNYSFTIQTTIRSMDDPFDGTIGGNPGDSSPADYKLADLDITCSNCKKLAPLKFTTLVAPRSLETASNNGALFVQVFDASGIPVPNASVHIVNTQTNPDTIIDETTDNTGWVKIVDAPPGVNAYNITSTKSGFSQDGTYPLGGVAGANPIKPDSTVVLQQVTAVSFAIDKVSSINLKTRDQMCVNVPAVSYSLTGAKLIGTNPNVIKNSYSGVTDSSGNKLLSNLEWDTYNLGSNDATYDIGGTNSSFDITLNPNEEKNISWLVMPKSAKALLVTVQDQSGQPINDASVLLTKSGFNQVKWSGRRDATHTNWANSLNTTSKTANLETDSPTGQITLKLNSGKYATSSEELVSSTIDFGTSNTTFQRLKINSFMPPTLTYSGPISGTHDLSSGPLTLIVPGNYIITININYSANIKGIAGGGAGGKGRQGLSDGNGGGGGGGGASNVNGVEMTLESGTTYTAKVGIGGTSSGCSNAGCPGGTTEFRVGGNTIYLQLTGGAGGSEGTGNVGAWTSGGGGGSAVVGASGENGGSGGSGAPRQVTGGSGSSGGGGGGGGGGGVGDNSPCNIVSGNGGNGGSSGEQSGGNGGAGSQCWSPSGSGASTSGVGGSGGTGLGSGGGSGGGGGKLFSEEYYGGGGGAGGGGTSAGGNGGAGKQGVLVIQPPPAPSPNINTDIIRKFQIATNNDNSTWNFIGPDGTANTYYSGDTNVLFSGHSGNRYLRYKVFMQTLNENYTPKVDDISIEFSSDCTPGGQAYFSGLLSGTYTLTVSKTGYQTSVNSINMSPSWQNKTITLTP